MKQKNKLLKVSLFVIMMLNSCTSIQKMKLSENKIILRKEVISKSKDIIEKNYNEIIDIKNIGLYKNGYENWKIILYGKLYFYKIIMKENGEIVKIEKINYK